MAKGELLPPVRHRGLIDHGMGSESLTRRAALSLVVGAVARAQLAPVQWVCPMDPDVRSPRPARCRKCGMALVAGIPEPVEYPVSMSVTPRAPRPGEPLTIRLVVSKPKGREVAKLQLIHEKLLHFFIISKDLSIFRHEHPEPQTDGSFLYRTVLPHGGCIVCSAISIPKARRRK